MDESQPKRTKMQQSLGKVVASTFSSTSLKRNQYQWWIFYSVIGAVEGRNHDKTVPNVEESELYFTLPQVDSNHCKIQWIALQTASPFTKFFRFSLQRLLPFHKLKINKCSLERDMAPIKYTETGAYIEGLDELFWKESIEMIERGWNDIISL